MTDRRFIVALLVVIAACVGSGCCSSFVAEREVYDAQMAERLNAIADRADARAEDVAAFAGAAADPAAPRDAVTRAGVALVRDLRADAAEARKLATEAARDASE